MQNLKFYPLKLNAQNLALGCIFLGIILRLIYPYDIEYKADQEEMILDMIRFQDLGEIKYIGAQSSTNFYNFGLTNWIFYLISYFSTSPVFVSMGLVFINSISLVSFYFIISKIELDHAEREIWFYSLALMSVSLIPILLSRNIWGPSLMPAFSFAIIYFYFRAKNSSINYLLLGFSLILASQIHLSGIILNFYFSIYVVINLIYKKNFKVLCFFIMGQWIGMIGMIPWLIKFMSNIPSTSLNSNTEYIKDLKILWYHFYNGLGLDLSYILSDYKTIFLKYPILFSSYTYLNKLIYFSITAIASCSIIYYLYDRIKSKSYSINLRSKTNIFLLISFLVYCTMFGLKLRLFPHYFPLTYPFIFLLVFKIVRFKWFRFLVILLNLVLSYNFMTYIHYTGGHTDSYYGKTYQSK
jgi:hypothetical protein